MAIQFPDPAVTNPWQDPASLQWWEHDGDGWLRTEATTPAILTGYKNVLINGDFRINQRNFNGDWQGGGPDANGYGYDRWKYLGVDKIQQEIEVANLRDGEVYTLSGYFNAAGAGLVNNFRSDILDGANNVLASVIDGVPASATFDAATHTTLKIRMQYYNKTPGLYAQLELGSVPTAFEIRPIGLELKLCQRYGKQLVTITNNAPGGYCYIATGTAIAATNAMFVIVFPEMATPETTLTTTGSFTLVTAAGPLPVTLMSIAESSAGSFLMDVDVASGLTAGQSVMLRANDDTASFFIKSELI